MKNTLFILAMPLGDTICFSPLLKDYKETYPNEKIYVKHAISSLEELFKYNTHVNIYDSNIYYDKIFEYNLNVIDPSSLGKSVFSLLQSRKNIITRKTLYLF